MFFETCFCYFFSVTGKKRNGALMFGISIRWYELIYLVWFGWVEVQQCDMCWNENTVIGSSASKLSPILVLQYAIKNAFRLPKSKFRNSNRSLDDAIV